MRIFDNLLSRSKPKIEEKALPWMPLNALTQLDAIDERSKKKLQIIFKYSSRCGISRVVLNQFEAKYPLTEENAELYFLDLINYRTVSNEIAQKYKVRHESPQLLIIKDGSLLVHGSHGGINDIDLENFI
jgi:bacillithiol system protein YtxJ